MVAGIPGTGIGGLFYLLSVLFMPFREVTKLVRGKSNLKRWKFIVMQFGLASGIIVGFWITGLILAYLIPEKAHLFMKQTAWGNVLKVKPFVISISVLSAVIIAVEILRFFIPKPSLKRIN
jgi:hypothetical protein